VIDWLRNTEAGARPGTPPSAGARLALALVVSAGPCFPLLARAEAAPDSAAVAQGHAPLAAEPGVTVMAYGPASDSLVRARCEGAFIRRVDIHCLDIFDPVPGGRFAGVYRAANRLHLRTRANTVRSQLLVAPGQPWSADRIVESQRLLRDLEYVEPEVIDSRLVGDSVDVQVVTHDQWTTQPELNLEHGGGSTFGSVGFSERNLLGLGLGVSIAFRDEPTGHTRSGELNGRHLLGSQLEGQLKAGTGTGGASDAFYVRNPYHSLDDPRTWTVAWSRTNVQELLFKRGAVAAQFPFRYETAQVEYGVGKRFPDGLVRRFAAGLTQLDRRYGVTVPEPGVAIAFPGGAEELKLRSLTGRVTFWKPHYIERRGIELFDPVEDFDVGSLVSMESGLVLRMLGSTADEGTAKLRLETGQETERFGFGFARGRLSTRIRGEPRETLAHLDARWYQQPFPNVTLVLAALGEAADRAPREVQSVVGGLNGLRAYSVQALAGTELWRFNAETRWVAARDVARLVSIGGAAFVDAARAWGPGGDREPWHHDAGFGLRLTFPHASLHQVARFDLAFPLSPSRDGRREPVFSFGSSQAF
jgi:hypothetical protein